jgi:hypothetical protein
MHEMVADLLVFFINLTGQLPTSNAPYSLKIVHKSLVLHSTKLTTNIEYVHRNEEYENRVFYLFICLFFL